MLSLSRSVQVLGDLSGCDYLLLQPADADEPDMAEEELAQLTRLCPGTRAALAAFAVDWWQDLTPWPCEPAFKGQPPFGDGAEHTLTFVTGELLPALLEGVGERPRVILGGYSLAGLFALWGGYQFAGFDAVVAASPSVWYPGWTAYAQTHRFQARAAYLSLGDKEAKTRNPLMRTVDTALLMQRGALDAQNIPNELEWNPGNHFVDAPLRTAKGVAAMIRTLRSMPAHS